MYNTKFSFDGSRKLFIKLPEETWNDKLEITLEIPEELRGKYLTVNFTDEQAIAVKNTCNENECDDCRVVYCQVYQEYAKLLNVENKGEVEVDDDRSVIDGHPNCRVGDCWECHNVSCAIHQGFEEMP